MSKRVVVIAIPHPEHPNMFLHMLRGDNARWTAPAGHALPGEMPVEAARRELFEETGVDLDKLEEVRNGEYPDEQGDAMQVHLFHAQCDPTTFHAKNDPDNEAVTYKYLDPSDHDSMHVPAERNILVHRMQGISKAEALEKMGVMRRLARFNPQIDMGGEPDYDLNDWQQYDDTKEVGYDDPEDPDDPDSVPPTRGENMRGIRDRLQDMEPNAKMRAMHKLAATTQSRRNPVSGEQEFLLHRGMSHEEHEETVGGSHVNHHSRTSWTPDIKTARGFASEYSKPFSAGKAVSAWVPKSKIVVVPRQYGDPSTMSGKNPFSHEHEVIVESGHNSHLHEMPKESPGPLLHEAIKDPKFLNTRINQRQPGAIAQQGKWKKQGIWPPPPIKLAASEKLAELVALEKGQEGNWRKEGYRLQYHEPRDKHGPYALHSVTAHDPQGNMVGSLQAEDLGDGRFQAHVVEVHPQHQRKGLASAMYVAMQHKTGLKATPDLEAQSPEGRKLWAQPGRKFGKSEAADAESERIKENRKTHKARKPHDFQAAEWTHPNGHPRCVLCGDEERTDGKCPGADNDGLEKMSRPRITFPKLGVGSEDHNVNVVATPQQRKILQHAIAQEYYPHVPGEHRMKMQAGKAATKAVSSNQGRQRIGGAVVNASQDPSRNKSGTDKSFAFAFGGKYQQPKGEPTYPKADPQIKQSRQTTLNTRIRHEGDHLVFNKLAQRLGSHEAKHKVLTKLMEHAFPDQEDRNIIYNYTRARGYNPFKDRKQTFVEEMVNSIQDILTDPPTRSQFESWYAGKHMGKPNFHGTQNMTNRLKAGWGKLAAAAMNVDESFAKAEYLSKAMDDQYLKDANAGYTVLVPVTVAGQKELAPGIPHHITVKMFRKPPENLTPEFMGRVEKDLARFKLPTPHPKQLRFEPSSIVSPRTGKTYYSLAVHGMPKEYSELYNHFRDVGITYPEYLPHITIDKDMHDKITSGELPMDRLDIQIHHPELKLGPNTVKVLGGEGT